FKEGGYKDVISAGLDFIPVVGNAKALVEAVIGRDPITGRKLESWERGASVAAILGGLLVKGVKHGGKAVAGIISGGQKATNKTVNLAKSPTLTNPTNQQAPSLAKNEASATTASPARSKEQGKGIDKAPNNVNYGDQYTKDGRRKVLKENIEYTTKEGYTYKTDSKGRISSCEGNLELGKGKRNNYAQRKVGREDRLADDEGGHLIASIFKGSGNIDNLVPMNGNLNKGEWKKLENSWADALRHGDEVKVKITPNYKGDSKRPDSFEIKYKIGEDGWEKKRFDNVPGGKLDE
ncbi:DNA/RNA non-specific endonuclease, partial [Solibacillus ferritrahens]|uniref:DNA/RNA non-specific endonuclease n=1 Tax=Solibacillus ferritrahens TaxID=3098620 RepID=UPI0030098A82